MNLSPDLINRLQALESQISQSKIGPHPDQTLLPEWRGAGVRIACESVTETNSGWNSDDLLIITPHSRALTWLFFELRDAFGGIVDRSSKHGFYGSLGEAARAHLATEGVEATDCRPLLHVVLREATAQAAMLESHGSLPTDPQIVVHLAPTSSYFPPVALSGRN